MLKVSEGRRVRKGRERHNGNPGRRTPARQPPQGSPEGRERSTLLVRLSPTFLRLLPLDALKATEYRKRSIIFGFTNVDDKSKRQISTNAHII